MKTPTIDSSAETQVIDQPNRRTIYDAGLNEIFMKSFIAGVGLGIGRMIAALIFFGIILGIFVTYLEPAIMSLQPALNDDDIGVRIKAKAITEQHGYDPETLS